MARRQPQGFELAHNKHPTKGASFKDLRRRKNRRRGKQSLRVWLRGHDAEGGATLNAKNDHDPRGWPNMCIRRQADGQPCGGWYFYLYRHAHNGIRAELLPDGGPGDSDHVCRDQQGGER